MPRAADAAGLAFARADGVRTRDRALSAVSDWRIPRVEDIERFVLVIGAPRCGTTTLNSFLKAHPAVVAPVVKETHFFARNDLRGLSDRDLRDRVADTYLRRFFPPGPPGRVGIDSSVTYLYAPEQLEPVVRLWPQTRFIVSLRDPLSMLPSLHQRLLTIGDENIGSFEKAWEAIPARRAGRRIPARCADARWLLYDEACRFSCYLERLFAAVGRDRCLIMLYDDLANDPAHQYRRLMKFADLEPASNIDLKPKRASHSLRLPWLQRLLKRPPRPISRLVGADKFWERYLDADLDTGPPPAVLSLRKRLLRWNKVQRATETLTPWLEDEIRERFQSEVNYVRNLLGRDLDHWLQPAPKIQA